MTSKKVLLGIGALAAAAIAFYAIEGWPPRFAGEEGAIGVAKKYQSEQINEADVVLQDPEVQDLLQSDFFYELVTDKDFQRAFVNGTLERAVTRIPPSLGARSDEDLAELGRALSDDEVRQHLAAGRYDEADAAAKKKGLKGVTVPIDYLAKSNARALEDLGKALSDDKVRQHLAAGRYDEAQAAAKVVDASIDIGVIKSHLHDIMEKQRARELTELGKGLSDDEVRQHMAAGRYDLAAEAAKNKKINLTSEGLTLLKFDDVLQGRGTDDVAALGRLLQKDAFHKFIPKAGGFNKLMLNSPNFKSMVKSGDLARIDDFMEMGIRKKAAKKK